MIAVTQRRVSLKDQAEDRYPRIPFDVPEGADSFEVRLEVEGDAVIDLGCEDHRDGADGPVGLGHPSSSRVTTPPLATFRAGCCRGSGTWFSGCIPCPWGRPGSG